MKDFIEQYEQEILDILKTREKKKTEYVKYKAEKREKIDELNSLIDDALSEDNLEKVEKLTMEKTGLETFLRTLEERNAAIDSPAQIRRYEERGSEVYHALVAGLRDADSKELEECKRLFSRVLQIARNGSERKNRAQGVMTKWTSNISRIDDSSSIGINSELDDLYIKIKNISF